MPHQHERTSHRSCAQVSSIDSRTTFRLQVSRDQSVEGVLSTQSMCDKRKWVAVSEAPLSRLD